MSTKGHVASHQESSRRKTIRCGKKYHRKSRGMAFS
jgi:hypothetical protein